MIEGVTPFPEYRPQDIVVLTFNVTWNCPVRCPYCYKVLSVSRSDKRILAKEDLIRECQIAQASGIREYRFSGGEPLSIGDKLFEYADIVYDTTGCKPSVMTSGFGLDDKWMNKARNRFSAIAVSVENPLDPLQMVVDNKQILDLIKNNTCDELFLTYGLTLITAEHFKNVERIFDVLYGYVGGKFMPQLDYVCLDTFVQPSSIQLRDIENQAARLFEKYGVIPYFFVYLVGSLVWLQRNALRIVLNLHPEGNYQIYSSLLERWRVEYKWKYYILEQQANSDLCRRCEWIDSCKHHPQWDIRYDWCRLRKAIFQGLYKGLITKGEK